jgi:hypothetical protein
MDRLKQNMSSLTKKISSSIGTSDIVNKGKNMIEKHKNNKKVLIALGTICLVIILFLAYMIYKYSRSNVTRVQFFKYVQPTNISIDSIEKNKLFTSTMGKEYSISMWFRINNWYASPTTVAGGSNDKHMLTMGNNIPANGLPTITLKNDINDIVIKVKTDKGLEEFELKTVPVKQWFKLTVIMKKNSVQVYLNSKLVVYKLLSGTIEVITSGISLFNEKNIDGHFSNVTFYPKALTPSEVSNLFDIGGRPTKKSFLYKIINMFVDMGQYSYDNILKGSKRCNS